MEVDDTEVVHCECGTAAPPSHPTVCSLLVLIMRFVKLVFGYDRLMNSYEPVAFRVILTADKKQKCFNASIDIHTNGQVNI